MSYHYLLYFLDSDAELQQIAREYQAGSMMTSEVKKKTNEVVWEYPQENIRSAPQVTDEIVQSIS